MVFQTEIKTNVYFKRYQTKYRRRREGKTDYQARTKLVLQDKNKYNSPKYRFVVRFSNTDITCQIIYATTTGDVTVAAAYSHELPRYGIPVGLTNYAAAYATGLLLARRVLTKLGLADLYQGQTAPDGEMYLVEEDEEGPRPFFALLDVGLQRTTTGNRVFGALKGAVDGGIEIPHSHKRFPGYDASEKHYEPSVHRDRIFGTHISEYMEAMKEEDDAKFKAHFARYLKNGITADKVEDMYKNGHAAIRKDPAFKATKKQDSYPNLRRYKRSKAQRDDRIRQIMENFEKTVLNGASC